MLYPTTLEPLSARARRVVIAVALFCAATRLLAVAQSLWDWDEALFCLGMRDYNVAEHHPHPPGFPAYIALAKLLRLVIVNDFRALQAINLVAAVLAFPAVFALCRQLRMRASTSIVAGALFAFLPNVWFFGGTAFSDVPSIVLVVLAVTWLLRGMESRNAYWFGTLLLALAVSIRPQNLLIGLVPGVLATIRRRPHEVLIALLIGVVICTAAFGGAIYATGSFDDYVRAVQHHSDYITRIDSFRAEARPPLWRLFDRFFLKQYQSPGLGIMASLFVIGSIVVSIRERNRWMLLNALIFGPFALFAWLMLDRFSVSRFSIGYQPMFVIFAADGIARLAKTAKREAAIAVTLIAAFIVYTLPALGPVRNQPSPTVSASLAVAKQIDPSRERLYVGYPMVPFVRYLASEVPFTRVLDDASLPLSSDQPVWLLGEVTRSDPEGFLFLRERGNLWNIARRHYFEVSLKRVTQHATFVAGWHPAERAGVDEWRWMSARSSISLPPAIGETKLRLFLKAPEETLPARPRLTVRLNGRLLETIDVGRRELELEYVLEPSARGERNLLELAIDDQNPGQRNSTDDRRMSLRFLSWGKA